MLGKLKKLNNNWGPSLIVNVRPLYMFVDDEQVKEASEQLKLMDVPAYKLKAMEKKKIVDAAKDLLSHRARARAFLQNCELNHLEQFQESLTEVLEYKREEFKKRQEMYANRQNIFDQIHTLLSENELTVDDLSNVPVKTRTVGGARARIIKYKCMIFDRAYYWSGQGVMPLPFKCHLAKGHTGESIQLEESEFFIAPNRPYNKIPAEYKESANKLLIKHKKDKLDSYVKHPIKSHPDDLPVREI